MSRSAAAPWSPGRKQVADGALVVAMVGEPVGRAPVQNGNGGVVGAGAQSPGEHVAQQVVQPHPVPGQRRHELVVALELGQQHAGTAASQRGVAQRRRQLVENRQTHQGVLALRRQQVEHLAGEVVGDIPVVATQTREPLVRD